MHDRRDGEYDRGGSRHEHGCDERCGHHGDHGGERRGDRPPQGGRGPDTRFLQLEMSQVLYAEAESVTKQAFRELLVEAAKARWRERFGDQITGLAQLAVDELMSDVLSSLEIEARIQKRNRERSRTQDRLRDIFAARGAGSEPGPEHEGGDDREGGSPRREGEGGGGGAEGGGHDHNP